MKLLRWAGAIALALIATPAASQTLTPQCRNAGGAYVPCTPTVQVDRNGNAYDTSVVLASANTPAGPITLSGGTYAYSQLCAGYGSVALRYRAADGSTMIPLVTKVVADAGATAIQFGAGSVVDVALTGTTGCNVTLSRVP